MYNFRIPPPRFHVGPHLKFWHSAQRAREGQVHRFGDAMQLARPSDQEAGRGRPVTHASVGPAGIDSVADHIKADGGQHSLLNAHRRQQ